MANKNFEFIEVSGCPGGDCYLVKYGGGAALCDTGFAFAAPAVAKNIRKALDGGALNCILLTHAHYDHVGGAPYLKAAFPEANLIANELTAEIFTRPGALRVMREMTAAAREEFGCGDEPRGDLLDTFSADILVPADANGTRVADGILAYVAPGHTRDSTGYYFDNLDLLVATETTGVIVSIIKNEIAINPTFITSYKQALTAANQMKEIGAAHIITPHFGLISGADAREFPDKARETIETFADFVMSRHNLGLSEDEILRDYLTEYYDKLVKPTGKQPMPAVLANARAMIPRLICELENSA